MNKVFPDNENSVTPENADGTRIGRLFTVQKLKSISKDRSRIYFEQLLCLLLVAAISYHNSGVRVALMAGFSLFGAVLMDMLGCAVSKKVYNPKDYSTLTAGLCIALLMPAGISYSFAFFGSALTIAVKHIFGGKNNYIFNPTAVAFVFLILCYPGQMLLFPKPLERLPAWGEMNPMLFSGSTSLENIDTFNIFIGNFTGAMGAVHILVILVTGICLMFRRSVSPAVMITALSANILFSGIATFRGVIELLAAGCFLFILVFLANDPQTLPKSFLGKIYYGMLFGGLTALFGRFGRVEGYPAFALLFANTMSERSDILAAQTVIGVSRTLTSAHKRLNSHEKLREGVESGTVQENLPPSLAATQEIIIAGHHDYNMPPIDNKIIKINRKKQNLIARILEKAGSLAEKRKIAETDRPVSKVNFVEELLGGVKELGSASAKRESHDGSHNGSEQATVTAVLLEATPDISQIAKESETVIITEDDNN